VRYEPYAGETLTVRTLFCDFFAPQRNAARLRRHLAAPIAIRDRVVKEQQLRELLAQGKSHDRT
jgi:hypothetical protein